mmetsp:Transcript_6604/g.9861  ORF Transcript_6604/g.9861 Transcript_6604/m.9861 type:complete len:215 (+) Transcript_6604:206-850(+)
MSSEESFNSSILELHCSRLISLWGKSDASRRALEERGPALVVEQAASAPATATRNKSGYAVQDDPESKNYTIPAPAPVTFHYNAKKRTYMENTKATPSAEQEQQRDHQSSTITTEESRSGTSRRRILSPNKKKRRRASPFSPEVFYGSRNCKISSKRLTDEQKQNRTRLVAADVSVVTASSAPAALDDELIILEDDQQWSLLSKVDDIDSFLLW